MSSNSPYDAPRTDPGTTEYGRNPVFPQGHNQAYDQGRSAADTQQGYAQPGDAQPGYGGQNPYGADPQRVGTQPGTNVGFVEAVQRMYSKYAQFSGRASRAEYWWVALFFFAVYAVLSVLASTLGTTAAGEPNALGTVISLVLAVFWLGSLVPMIALAVRRLHDANYSGWFYLLALIPVVGGIVLLVLTVMPSKAEGARFDR